MTLLETSPADWLRALLNAQPGVRDAFFDLQTLNDNHEPRILLTTSSGQRLSVRVRPLDDDYDLPE